MTTAIQVYGRVRSARFATYGIALAIAATAAMLGAFVCTDSNYNKALPRYAEGGWVDGKRHSQGGTLIEAEKGEYVLSRGGGCCI